MKRSDFLKILGLLGICAGTKAVSVSAESEPKTIFCDGPTPLNSLIPHPINPSRTCKTGTGDGGSVKCKWLGERFPVEEEEYFSASGYFGPDDFGPAERRLFPTGKNMTAYYRKCLCLPLENHPGDIRAEGELFTFVPMPYWCPRMKETK